MVVPNLFNDVDGKFRGMDGKIYEDKDRNTYTVFSLWDTFRATHPLYTLIERKRTVDFINTMLAHYEQKGLLPVWELAGNETNCMIGTHGVSVIADAIQKGIKGFSYEKAFEAMQASLEQDMHDLNMFDRFGYMPSDQVNSSVSKTLEFAYNYWCLAETALTLGKKELYSKYIKKAQYYKNTFDPETGFMRPKRNGTWLSPFDAKRVDFNYTEANAWQYSFFVPQDVNGLIELMGGEDVFESKLDELFTTDSETTGRHQADITGLVGQYAHGNEPSHHMAYLYNYIGKPWKTQRYVDQILNNLYSAAPDGYSGNEDCGQMSAWYVFSALGFYPVTPGSDTYIIGKPMFQRIILNFEDGKYFIIESDQYNPGDFVRSVLFNKKPYNKSFLKHEDIIKGGRLSVYTGSQQSLTFGVDQDQRPVSRIKDDLIVIAPVVTTDISSFREQQVIEIASMGMDHIYYRLKKENGRFKKWKRYDLPLIVDYSGEIEFYAKNENGESSVQLASFTKIDHNWSIDLTHDYSPQYTGGGEKGLINGIHGGQSFSDGSWQGFHGKDFVATVDLNEVRTIKELNIGFLQDQRSWIWFPQKLIVEVSDDNSNFVEKASLIPEDKPRIEGTLIENYKLKFSKTQARYVRVTAKNRGVCPDWHPGAGGKAWLFVDEIEID
jgi:hypothetical protein